MFHNHGTRHGPDTRRDRAIPRQGTTSIIQHIDMIGGYARGHQHCVSHVPDGGQADTHGCPLKRPGGEGGGKEPSTLVQFSYVIDCTRLIQKFGPDF